jgi:polysaccharide export outer membrane protein
MLRPRVQGTRDLLRQRGLQQVFPTVLHRPLLSEDGNLLWYSMLLVRPSLLPRQVLRSRCRLLRLSLLRGRLCLLQQPVRATEAVTKQSLFQLAGFPGGTPYSGSWEGDDSLILSKQGKAELVALFTQLVLICLVGTASAQDVISPQAPVPVTSVGAAIASDSTLDGTRQRYVIARDDLLEIDVVGVQELSREYRVDGDGMITLPMLSRPVRAAGLSLDQLSKSIGEYLVGAGLLRDPQVTVSVKSSPWNTVVLSGAAKKPGVYPVYGHTTLLELLTEAEGLSDDAGNTAIVTRAENAPARTESNSAVHTGNASSRTSNVDVGRLWRSGEDSLDLDLYPGDRVTVERAGIVYVLGAVNRAGGFVLTNDQEQMTVLRAIALAGNFTREARPTHAVIIRKESGAPGGKREVRVDLKKVLSSQAPDQPLIASDILYVPESGAKRTLDTVVNTAVSTSLWRLPY